tara:strand:- start:407 stop:691 length:285 start_codon:yes stop_codon:yes gene_type:complete
MTENTLMDRLRAAERDECCNDRLCDEAADALDLGEQAVVDLIAQNAELIKRIAELEHVLQVQGGLLVGQTVELARRARIVGKRLLDAAYGEDGQ